jgi:hypothetical protein
LYFSSKLKLERSQQASNWGGGAVAMRKPLLDNSAKAKADFKAMMRPITSFTLNMPVWQIADPNYAEAETTLAWRCLPRAF